MNYQFTIIMSNYNQASYIRLAIESVLMQKVSFQYQLIITDDNSTKDDSIHIISEYEKKYPEKIKVLYNEENGKYLKNILRAKDITKTPYFCLLDADDYYTDSYVLQRAYDYLEQHKDYVIYYENVNYLIDDKETTSFISQKTKSGTYTFNDYLSENIPIVQTTGQFYRNVIFKNGIPPIISEAVGTTSERSFEGDFDRFIIHLNHGKAYFNNKICGIYRILPNAGIWSKLTQLQKHIVTLQTYYDYNRYFQYEYSSFFMEKMYKEIVNIENIKEKQYLNLQKLLISDTEQKQINIIYQYLADNNFTPSNTDWSFVSDCSIKKLITTILKKLLKKLHK